MGRKNRRSNRSKRNRRTKRSNMRGGSGVVRGMSAIEASREKRRSPLRAPTPAAPKKISMTVENVGQESVSLQWWDNSINAWSIMEYVLPAQGTHETHLSDVGTPWRAIITHQKPGKELSWVLGDDGSEQRIHVDLTPSKWSLTWTASPSESVPDMYECANGCGFSGTYAAVVAHETTCRHRQADDEMTELQQRQVHAREMRDKRRAPNDPFERAGVEMMRHGH